VTIEEGQRPEDLPGLVWGVKRTPSPALGGPPTSTISVAGTTIGRGSGGLQGFCVGREARRTPMRKRLFEMEMWPKGLKKRSLVDGAGYYVVGSSSWFVRVSGKG
jgi:hypothetical protein